MMFDDMFNKETYQQHDIDEELSQEKVQGPLDISNKEPKNLDSETLEDGIEAAPVAISDRLDGGSPDDIANARNWPVSKISCSSPGSVRIYHAGCISPIEITMLT
jgi:hypothetical protein